LILKYLLLKTQSDKYFLQRYSVITINLIGEALPTNE